MKTFQHNIQKKIVLVCFLLIMGYSQIQAATNFDSPYPDYPTYEMMKPSESTLNNLYDQYGNFSKLNNENIFAADGSSNPSDEGWTELGGLPREVPIGNGNYFIILCLFLYFLFIVSKKYKTQIRNN